MPKLGAFKSSAMPVTALMNNRSSPDMVRAGWNRLVQNISVGPSGKVMRMPGWSAFVEHDESGDPIIHDNSDLHDQLIGKVLGYDSYSWTTPASIAVTGYQYTYLFPGMSIPGTVDFERYDTIQCGYFLDEATSVHAGSGPYIWQAFVGYPYFEAGGWSGETGDCVYSITDLPYLSDALADCNSGAPEFYVTPYFQEAYALFTPGETIDAYGYGDITNFYTSTPEETYTYCGDLLSYRSYCSDNFSSYGGREAITLLKEFQTGTGSRKLVAGTRSRIYVRSARTHNWKVIADGLGGSEQCNCSGRRFRAAQLGDSMVFTNNYDPPLFYTFDEPSSGCNLQSANPSDELTDLQIYKAGTAVEYKGFMFLLNLEVAGKRYVSKAIWSDYADILAWAPGADRLSGDSDIGDPGEAILNAKTLGDYLFIYKERSIWRVTLVDPGEGLFNFQQVYAGEKGLRYPETLISVGTSHFWMGHDNIYTIDLYSQLPRPVDWMEPASGIIFDDVVFGSDSLQGGIEASDCDQAVSGWDPVRNQLWFSWVSKRNSDDTSVAETTQPGAGIVHSASCPNRSICFNMLYSGASYVDHGFSAFCSFREYDTPDALTWLIEGGACDDGDIERELKDGEPFYYPSLTPGNDVTCIWNETEDPNLPMSESSLCSALSDQYFDDICGGCDSGTMFLMASAADMCIKFYNPSAYNREHFTYATQSYSQVGYATVIESPAISFASDSEKYLNRLTVEFSPPVQSPTPYLYARLGYASQPECAQWATCTPQELACQVVGAGRPATGQRRYDKAYFNRLVRGRYLFYRFSVTGTTGETIFSRVEMHTRKAEA